jgi:hypothetical protein
MHEMKLDNKLLRGVLRRLPVGDDPEFAPVLAQEALDLLAVIADLKPVYVLGRPPLDPDWDDAVLACARTLGLHVAQGPYWQADDTLSGFPAWFRASVQDKLAGLTAFYISKTPVTAPATVADEARLLGFPPCCVAAHYQRERAFNAAWLDDLRIAANGDEAEMRRMLDADEGLDFDDLPDETLARYAAAADFEPAPFTSINMCAVCRADPGGPAHAVGARYAELARAVDPDLYEMLRSTAG